MVDLSSRVELAADDAVGEALVGAGVMAGGSCGCSVGPAHSRRS